MKNKKKTNTDIDNLLVGRNIIRLDDYLGANKKIKFGCGICEYIWSTTPDSVLNSKSGCKNCKGLVKLTNEDVDLRLKNRDIKRIESINGVNRSINFLCNICNYVWPATPSSIFKGNGCPQCSNRLPLTNEEVDERLIGRNIVRLEDVINCAIKIKWQCVFNNGANICNYTWKTSPNKVINDRKQGCPKCAGNAKYTNDYIDKCLVGKNIRRLEDVISSKNKIKFECLNNKCSLIWKTSPIVIVNVGCGCPNCSARKNEKLIHSIFVEKKINFERYKKYSGICNFVIDFYLPDINTIIEYNGDQHYRPVKFNNIKLSIAEENFRNQKIRDNLLEKFCKENKINLLWIDGRKYFNNKLIKYLNEELIPALI